MQLDKSQAIHVLYEVYDKRALHEPIHGLPLLDRDTSLRKMENSARRWGGVVAKVEARVTSWTPFERDIVEHSIVWVHTPRKKSHPVDEVTFKELRGKIRRGL